MRLNKIYLGDCLKVMQRMPDGSIDLTVTSPPYDNLRTYNNSLEWGAHIWEPVIKELYRITKEGGVVVWVVGDATLKGSETGASFKQALWAINCGFKLHDTMIYKKSNIPKNHNRYEQDFEYMFIFCKNKLNTFNPIKIETKNFGSVPSGQTIRQVDGTKKSLNKKASVKKLKIKGNIWDIACGYMKSSKDKIAFEHPAIFPEKLAHDHIVSWSNEGDTVLDPFMGSGTTGKMAQNLKRNFIGIEKDKEYWKLANSRLRQNAKILKKQSTKNSKRKEITMELKIEARRGAFRIIVKGQRRIASNVEGKALDQGGYDTEQKAVNAAKRIVKKFTKYGFIHKGKRYGKLAATAMAAGK